MLFRKSLCSGGLRINCSMAQLRMLWHLLLLYIKVVILSTVLVGILLIEYVEFFDEGFADMAKRLNWEDLIPKGSDSQRQ